MQTQTEFNSHLVSLCDGPDLGAEHLPQLVRRGLVEVDLEQLAVLERVVGRHVLQALAVERLELLLGRVASVRHRSIGNGLIIGRWWSGARGRRCRGGGRGLRGHDLWAVPCHSPTSGRHGVARLKGASA